VTPVEKVIELLKKLKAQTEEEGKSEAAALTRVAAVQSRLIIDEGRIYTKSDAGRHVCSKFLEEIDRTVRTTHIQLEFCVETFDPNAKKFSDQKKELYKLRTAVEEELSLLKEKQGKALEDFKESEEALDAAGIEFSHPVDENNEEVLSRRSKMVEYKAHLSKQEEVKIAAEREELKRAKGIQGQQFRGKMITQ